MEPTLTLENPVFAAYAFYAAVLIIKMGFMSIWTVLVRNVLKVFANPEDEKLLGDGKTHASKANVETVERVKRIHMNDLENIPAFLLLGPLYVLAGPAATSALWHFRVFTLARFGHFFAYLIPLPMPSRSVFFSVGFFTMISMAVQILLAAL